MMTRKVTKRDAAIGLHDDGFSIFPADAQKRPRLSTWKIFQEKRAPRFLVECWWTRWPDANIAMATGQVSGLDVIDLDIGRDANWPPDGCELPTACVVTTPSGGLHYYLRHTPGVRNSAGTLAKKIDVRGDGGYVLVPPSKVNENAYRFETGSPAEARETPAPEWLCRALLIGRRQKAARATEGTIPKGQRDGTLTSLAGSMRRRGMAEAEIFEALRAVNRRCEPPLEESNLRKIAKSIGKKPTAAKQFELTDLGNAERFAAQHAERAKYVQELGWLVFDGKAWRRDPAAAERLAKTTARALMTDAAAATDSDASARLAKFAIKSQSQRGISAMLALAQSELAIDARAELFDRDPYLLNVENGTLDLRDGELRPHSAGDYLSKLAGTKCDPQAECPTFLEFLDRSFDGNRDVIDFVQRAVGYTLSGDTSERCLFFCYGTGANGKTTLLETLKYLLGDYARHADIESFLTRNRASVPNDIARLAGARLVCAVETGEGRRLAEGLVKQLTGQDTVAARYLFREFFEYKPAFKLWVAANHKPTIRGTDNAIWDRIRLIPFNITIPEAERDPTLPERLRGELAGILRWAVQGCLTWIHDEGLHQADEVKSATAAYRSEMDTLAAFIDECCTVGDLATVTAKVLYRGYVQWCEENGERPVTQTALGTRLGERGFQKERGRTGIVYCGIGLAEGQNA